MSQDRFDHIRGIIEAAEASGENAAAYFHKGLSHDAMGLVNLSQFGQFISALTELDSTGDPTDLSSIPFEPDNRKWVNPLSGWATDTELSDPCFHTIPAPPLFDSEIAAAEATELYWMSLLRDLPFQHWSSEGSVSDAVSELSGLKLFINPDQDVNASPDAAGNSYISRTLDVSTLFRGGDLFKSDPLRERMGPFVSQFLAQEIPYGTLRVDQRVIYAVPYHDYMTEVDEWRMVQNGEARNPEQNLLGVNSRNQRRYISSMRDLATYVHFDQLFQAYLNAALILIQNSYPFGEGNPYGQACPKHGGIGSPLGQSALQMLGQNQQGFGTFGGAHVLSLVAEAATRALKAVWRQKWTHLRLRPEAYGGLAALLPTLLGSAGEAFCDSVAFNRSKQRASSGLLPMAFPEGSPMHPAYGAGHATVAGACVTILKAFFKESEQIRTPKVASADGQQLLDYGGTDAGHLTVGLELDKLAANISIGRNMAGVHWRSDYTQSVLLGQRVATDMLFRQSRDYIEDYHFHFTTFGGGEVEVSNRGVDYTAPAGTRTQVLDASQFGMPDRITRSQDAEIAIKLLRIV